jgi:divalent metal cation (Fe/Co/Zn/Cd) transporter
LELGAYNGGDGEAGIVAVRKMPMPEILDDDGGGFPYRERFIMTAIDAPENAPGRGLGPAEDRDWNRIALSLVVATLAYNVVEAIVALWSGSEANSIALVGFGLDSIIECVAAGALLWRLSAGAQAEHRVQTVVGATFLLLAAYVTVQAGWTLWQRAAAEESLVGIVLAAASLVIMPLLSWGKLRAAREIGSAALRAEAKETLACSYLSLTLLLGLVAHSAAGWWWADPLAALLMVPWLVKEGLEGLRGETCCDD